jgi:hypothetical protein
MADNPKQVIIGTDVVGELLAVFENNDDVVAALRARMTYVGMSFGLLEVLAKPPLPEGAAAKYLAPLQLRSLTISSLLRLAEPLGLKAILVVDEALTRKWQKQWTKRDTAKVHGKRQPSLGQTQIRRLLRPLAAELGRRGGIARQAKLTAEQRREIGLAGARARWQGRRP